MNNFDIENINKIIKSREPIEYSDKGDENIKNLQTLSTEELVKKVKDYEDNLFNKGKIEFKEIVKYLFDTYADKEEDDNIIVLSECWLDESDYRYMYDIGTDKWRPYSDFYEFETGYRNNWAQSVKFMPDDKNVTNSYTRLWELMTEMKIPFAEEIYKNDSSINYCWHGFVCVTKDYKIVNFVCRDDGFMLNEAKKAPNIVMEL